MPTQITKNTPVEDLINGSPLALEYLVRKGVCGIRCEFPITGTYEQMASEKNFSEYEMETTLIGLNNLTE